MKTHIYLNAEISWQYLIERLFELSESEALFVDKDDRISNSDKISNRIVSSAWLDLFSMLERILDIRCISVTPYSLGHSENNMSTHQTKDYVVCFNCFGFLLRFVNDKEINDDKIQKINSFLPLLYQALSIQYVFNEHEKAVHGMYSHLNILPMSIALLDECVGRVFCNTHLLSLMESYPELSFLGQYCQVTPKTQDLVNQIFDCKRRLDNACFSEGNLEFFVKSVSYSFEDKNVLSGGLSSIQLSDSSNKLLYLIVSEKVPSQLQRENIESDLLINWLKPIYDLTEKECVLALNVARGVAPKDYAIETHRSIATVQTQLKSIFRKLDVNGQQALSQRILDEKIKAVLCSIGRVVSNTSGLVDHA